MSPSFSSLDELGDGYGFRKVRGPLGITAFGVNAIVYPPGYEGFLHYHDKQDELYFVHSGKVVVEVEGETASSARAASSTRVDDAAELSNPFEEDAIVFVVGGKEVRRARRASRRSGRPRAARLLRQKLERHDGRRPSGRAARRAPPAPRRARSSASRSSRSSRPSSAACARNGKSSCGIVSPPCVTAIATFGRNRSARVDVERASGRRHADERRGSGVAAHPNGVDEPRRSRSQRTRSRRRPSARAPLPPHRRLTRRPCP